MLIHICAYASTTILLLSKLILPGMTYSWPVVFLPLCVSMAVKAIMTKK